MSLEKLLNLLDTVKSVPDSIIKKYYTFQEVAEYYDAKYGAITSVISRNNLVFQRDGINTLRGDDLNVIKRLKNINKNIFIMKTISLYGLVRIGLYLKNNIVANMITELVLKNKILIEYYMDTLSKTNQSLKKQNTITETITSVFIDICKIETQVKVGKYFVDILLDNKIIIECDEYGHKYYESSEEVKREVYLQSNGYEIIRYNPDSEKDCSMNLINIILRKYILHRNLCT